ncbi:MAG: hypothetical protein JXB29_00815 [Sedimentisphaerales bacterium]|nr:hypothetical protein [Sedimentisphaerales bacterium]
MKGFYRRAILLAIVTFSGCHSDIVCTPHLKDLTYRCVHIEPIQSQNPYVGKVLRDVLEKEFIRRKFEICDADTATIHIAGSTFMTLRNADSSSSKSRASNQAIESVSIIAKDPNGNVLLTASYDNKEQYTASKLAKELGSALANKLK